MDLDLDQMCGIVLCEVHFHCSPLHPACVCFLSLLLSPPLNIPLKRSMFIVCPFEFRSSPQSSLVLSLIPTLCPPSSAFKQIYKERTKILYNCCPLSTDLIPSTFPPFNIPCSLIPHYLTASFPSSIPLYIISPSLSSLLAVCVFPPLVSLSSPLSFFLLSAVIPNCASLSPLRVCPLYLVFCFFSAQPKAQPSSLFPDPERKKKEQIQPGRFGQKCSRPLFSSVPRTKNNKERWGQINLSTLHTVSICCVLSPCLPPPLLSFSSLSISVLSLLFLITSLPFSEQFSLSLSLPSTLFSLSAASDKSRSGTTKHGRKRREKKETKRGDRSKVLKREGGRKEGEESREIFDHFSSSDIPQPFSSSLSLFLSFCAFPLCLLPFPPSLLFSPFRVPPSFSLIGPSCC